MRNCGVIDSESMDEYLAVRGYEALASVLEKMNNGQGTAARILNDGTFYENLLENTDQLQTLLEEMRTFIAEWRNKSIDVKIF